ncbi:YkvA family protein [Chryseobacterium sp. MP_3.2]|uniref:YkvA family protein n=1 Tax=Chryseobacterium sp. MP_3.2 TaxID=3071712 RepID=UPI002E1679C9
MSKVNLQWLQKKVQKLKRETLTIYAALRDKRTPLIAKIFAAITVAYLFSPIDLIPDFIPVLGLLDDLILVPILIKVTISLIPNELYDDIKSKINAEESLQKKWYLAIPIILIYSVLLLILYFKFFKNET